jgi:hypothetical protein
MSDTIESLREENAMLRERCHLADRRLMAALSKLPAANGPGFGALKVHQVTLSFTVSSDDLARCRFVSIKTRPPSLWRRLVSAWGRRAR